MENNNQIPQWYILQTLSGYEKMVQQNVLTMVENNNLKDFVLDVIVPEEEEIVEKNGKKKIVLRKKFPCYVFIKMVYTKHVWYMVNNTRGVITFCGPQGKPLPLTDEEVKRNQLEKLTQDDVNLAVGDKVTVISTYLKGYVGEIKEVDYERQVAKVILTMHGKETVAEISLVEIEKLKKQD